MAEIKKATPEKIILDDKGWDSDYGKMYTHVIKFPGSDIDFEYMSKQADGGGKFKEGVEAEFEYEKKKDRNDKVHHRIKPISNKPQGGRGGYVFNLDNEKQKQKVNCIAYATSYCKDLVSMDKLPVNKEKPMEDMKGYITELIAFMQSEIDKVK